MPRNLVLETANSPGNSTAIALAGAPTGYRPWLVGAGAGAREDYVMRGADGLWEVGSGYVTAGSPNTFTRETVIDGSAGPGNRVNFTGQVDIYSDLVAGPDGKLRNAVLPEPLLTQLNLTVAQSIPTGVETTVSWNNAPFNTLGGVNGAAPYTAVTVPAGGTGWHRVTLVCNFDPATAGTVRRVKVFRTTNGTPDAVLLGETPASLGTGWLPVLTRPLQLVVGEVISVTAFHDRGAALAFVGNLTLERIRG
ncbi:hypothetical protein [Roseomonas sp. BN140053]|uniref:hypothetical protein n=1 Tax=Roseomonas sp. BN140053 TaxID=3391898 RepID=UPI0039E79172